MSGAMLSDAERDDLRCLAGLIVPASAAYGVPGADDAAIFADICASLGRDAERVRSVLARLRASAGGSFAMVALGRRAELAQTLRAEGGPELVALTRLVLLCYYRDDRVMRSLGLEPRPPFPIGHVVEQGDWSLLDPVRGRAPFWRQVT